MSQFRGAKISKLQVRILFHVILEYPPNRTQRISLWDARHLYIRTVRTVRFRTMCASLIHGRLNSAPMLRIWDGIILADQFFEK